MIELRVVPREKEKSAIVRVVKLPRGGLGVAEELTLGRLSPLVPENPKAENDFEALSFDGRKFTIRSVAQRADAIAVVDGFMDAVPDSHPSLTRNEKALAGAGTSHLCHQRDPGRTGEGSRTRLQREIWKDTCRLHRAFSPQGRKDCASSCGGEEGSGIV